MTRLALTFCSVFLLLGQEPDSDINRHFSAARAAQSSGDFDLAAKEYTAVLRLQPHLPEARVNLGLVFYLQNRYAESAREMGKALAETPALRGAELFLGIDYVKLGEPQQAIPRLKSAVQQEPGNKQARIWLSAALSDAGLENEAVLELRDAKAAFPADPDILFLLGQAYGNAANDEMERVFAVVGTPLYHQALGDLYREQQTWTKAIGHYQRALEKDPNWSAAHLGLGEVYLQQAKLDQAQTEFLAAHASAKLAEVKFLEQQTTEGLRLLDAAIQEDPTAAAVALSLPPQPFSDNPPLAENLLAEYQQAAASLSAVASSPAASLALAAIDLRLDLRQESARAWQNYLAAVKFVPQNFESARSHFLGLQSAHPKDVQTTYFLAKTDHALSLAVLSEMLSAAPDSPRTHQLIAQTLAAREENEKALAEYQKAEAAVPAFAGVHFSIGELFWRLNEPDRALDEFQQELHLNPGYAEASAGVGTILLKRHQLDAAIPYLEKAIQRKPSLLAAHQELGRAFLESREFAKARHELELAQANDPEGDVHYMLGSVYKQLGLAQQAQIAFAESRRIKTERLNALNAEEAER